ncbi:cell division protein FtsA [Texcoconibacillus texcoconensis]|uniref:Cell division protein FtsA n=1 Tax=Texcoconibacillus texcoconensis TaxID=1095777 RepID=A0A840QN31_9BACI|nr:cell division protein FtsA [Texcoconibacillus texcoconensis]MBB5172776.1 cell division protein FtsA [Texcoconibacillus texcoconensis]
MNEKNYEPIFALDIGTRSVVGLLLHKQSDGYKVIDIKQREHRERSMLDGQIHNVIAVSKIISEIKMTLEEKHGPLTSVCVAAAGRSLRTERAEMTVDIEGKPLFQQSDILHLELSAVQNAQYALAQQAENENQPLNDHCVGYSVLNYKLDGEVIGSLVDQNGKQASVEVIATFLPKVVVESLLAALHRAELRLEALTLEPIAAINVLIPPSMRRLNVALVDIGAGTSDIAITNEGTVTAYGMVPVAGDEITDAISEEFLLDFPDAEYVKRTVSEQEEVTMMDILGFETTYHQSEIIEKIDHAIEKLAEAIKDEILSLNQQAPKAVMLVGGGSMTSGLTEKLTEKLSLPTNRVAIRGIDAIQSLASDHELNPTPELVTPIGIAIAAKESPVEYLSIEVNNQTVRLFDMKQLTVGDGLLAAGIEISKLYGKPGMAKIVEVDGRIVSLPGKYGQSPVLTKNGQNTTLDSSLEDGDVIFVERGSEGHDAEATVKDIIGSLPNLTVTYNDRPVTIEGKIFINDAPVSLTTTVNDRDIITTQVASTAGEVVKEIEPGSPLDEGFIRITINGSEKRMQTDDVLLEKNHRSVSARTPVQDGDHIHYKRASSPILVAHMLKELERPLTFTIDVSFNGDRVKLTKTLIKVYRHGEILNEHTELQDGDELTINEQDVNQGTFIFQDLFNYVDVDTSPKRNQKPVLLQNGESTSFSAPIQHGDELEIQWLPI